MVRLSDAIFAAAGVTAALAILVTPTEAQDGEGPADGQQIVLVTGSTSGLGREVALRMGDLGWHVIVHGRDRAHALDRAARALDDFACEGVTTTLDFHRELVRDEAFRADAADVHTRWVENVFLPRNL